MSLIKDSLITDELFLQLKDLAFRKACLEAQKQLRDINTFQQFKQLVQAPEYTYWMFIHYKSDIPEFIIPELEDLILLDEYYSLDYVYFMIKGPWPKGEEFFSKDSYFNSVYQLVLYSLQQI